MNLSCLLIGTQDIGRIYDAILRATLFGILDTPEEWLNFRRRAAGAGAGTGSAGEAQ